LPRRSFKTFICSIFQTGLFSIIRFWNGHVAAYAEHMPAAHFRDR